MKLIKKIISSICVASMIASFAVVAMASDKEYTQPTIEASLTAYDKTTGEGKITVSIHGLGTVSANPILTTLENKIYFNEGSFDESYYTYNPSPMAPVKQHVKALGSFKATLNANATEKYFKVGFGPDNSSTIMADCDLYTVDFKVTDTSVTNKLVLKESYIVINAYDADWVTMNKVSYGQAGASGEFTGTLNVSSDDITILIPAAAESGASTALNVDPTDVGLDADAWTDGTSTVAVGLANVAAPASAASKIEWTIKATPVGGSEETKTQSFDLDATIEAAATIGLIVNYDTNEFSSVSVVSGALK